MIHRVGASSPAPSLSLLPSPFTGWSSTQLGTKMSGSIDQIVTPDMCYFCFDVLKAHLNGNNYPQPDFPDEKHPLFVTWTTGRNKRLRGCIGTFGSLYLNEGLPEYAITSALKDTRFEPISQDEIDRLNVSVSILCNFEDGKDYMDWQIGLHGVRIEFLNDRGSKRSATFLPEIAPEQGWDHLATIDALLRKGGFQGEITPQVRKAVKLQRYQSQKKTVSFPEYEAFRNKNPL